MSGKREIRRVPVDDRPIVVKSVPASCYRKLESAERRLVGSISRKVPRAQMVVTAERVRRAQLGVLKARTRVATVPAALDDGLRAQHLANLEAATRSWNEMSVDEIIARYAVRALDPRVHSDR